MKAAVKKQKLTRYEQEIEDAIDLKKKPSAKPKMMREVKEAMLDLKERRGGARKGAGRPKKDYIKTNLLLSPEARQRLEELSQETGSLSAAANQLLVE